MTLLRFRQMSRPKDVGGLLRNWCENAPFQAVLGIGCVVDIGGGSGAEVGRTRRGVWRESRQSVWVIHAIRAD